MARHLHTIRNLQKERYTTRWPSHNLWDIIVLAVTAYAF